jgi:hypothetical protein
LALHPRKIGNPGNAAALSPAITLGVLSDFEGFTEDFFATALYRQGQSFAQIAKKLNLPNPDVADVEVLAGREFPQLKPQIGVDFNITVWASPRSARRPYGSLANSFGNRQGEMRKPGCRCATA